MKIRNKFVFALGIFCFLLALIEIAFCIFRGFTAIRVCGMLMTIFAGVLDILNSLRFINPPIGINPHGVFCGKCLKSDCSECPNKDIHPEDN